MNLNKLPKYEPGKRANALLDRMEEDAQSGRPAVLSLPLERGLEEREFRVVFFPMQIDQLAPSDERDHFYEMQEDGGYILAHTYPYRYFVLTRDCLGFDRSSMTRMEARDLIKRYWYCFDGYVGREVLA